MPRLSTFWLDPCMPEFGASGPFLQPLFLRHLFFFNLECPFCGEQLANGPTLIGAQRCGR
jgi:hypothetical protein